jgi:AraC family ethanolamine operon transcriptional activator
MEEVVRLSSDWELDFVQLSGGPLEAGAVLYSGPNVTIKHVTYSCRFHQRGTPPPGMFTVGVLDDALQHIANGQVLQRGSILRFNTPDGLDVVAEAGFAGFPISILETFLFEVADQVGIALSPQQLTGEAVIPTFESAELASLRGDLHALIGAIRQGSLQFESIAWVESFEFSIVARLLVLLAEPPRRSILPQHHSVRYRGLMRAVQHIRQCEHEPITIKALCSAAHVSWRTLDRGFREHFDITAKQYLNKHRLHQVRRQFLAAHRGSRINDIANDWGFFHPGQFAADYRKCFGELPRQTVQSAQNRI